MASYSAQSRDGIFKKDYGFLSFAKNMSKNIVKNISKNLSSTYSEKILDHAKQPATDALKAVSKRAIQKTAKITKDLICNKITDKIINIMRTSPQNTSEAVQKEAATTEFERKI